ncbi:hypothetical protein K8T06_01565, partial [bacterium]|nr:hypothetical protein [bacterium]
PSWDSNTDYRRINIPKGETIIDLLPEFPWPDTGPDIIQGNYVYAALLNFNNTAILKDSSGVEMWTFNFGPEL